MLSRLISLLRRIPAVKWAFTRLRPSPHGGSIDVAPIAASDSLSDIAEAAPAFDSSISTELLHADAVVTAPPAQEEAAISAFAESLSAVPGDTGVIDDSSRNAPADGEPAMVEEAPVSAVEASAIDALELIDDDPPAELSPIVEESPALSVEAESKPVDAPEPVADNYPSVEVPAEVEADVAAAAPVSSVDVANTAVDAPVLVVNDDPCSGVVVDVEPAIVDDAGVALAGNEVPAANVSESSIESDPSPSVAAEIKPISANDLAPVTIAAAELTSRVITTIAPEPVLDSPAPKIPTAPKARAKAAEPADRAALIRQRWAETGIRMWNPRLHGAGEATLNIQGSIGLLPPAPGETMPRYDKLEFKMLGGQIVCEGVIVEAPAQANQRSFTRLAEPGKPERAREPMRERQAALA